MSFVRQPLLNTEQTEQLKAEVEELWKQGYDGQYIARRLGFGEKGKYQKLKPQYIYFYRQKFNLPKRREGSCQKGESRYNTKPIDLPLLSFKQFQDQLNEYAPLTTFTPFHILRKRAFLILHFLTPLRMSEIIERTIQDFELTPTHLTIHLLRKKKKYKITQTDEPIRLPLNYPLIAELVNWLKNPRWITKENVNGKEVTVYHRPFKMSHTCAWHSVNSVFPNYYSHHFRFSYISKSLEDNLTSPIELSAKTGLHYVTLNRYILASNRHQDTLDSRLIERAKQELS